MEKNMSIEKRKAKAFSDSVVLFGSYVLLFIYNSYIKLPVESMTQDYPSFWLNIICNYLPMLIPFPSTIYFLQIESPRFRKYLKYFTVFFILAFVFSVSGLLLSGDISWTMSFKTFGLYAFIIVFGAIFISPYSGNLLSKLYEWFKKI
jgi:hypothetical protein